MILATSAGLASNLELTVPLVVIVTVGALWGLDIMATYRRAVSQAKFASWRRDQRRVPPEPPVDVDVDEEDSFALDFFDGAELYEELERTAS